MPDLEKLWLFIDSNKSWKHTPCVTFDIYQSHAIWDEIRCQLLAQNLLARAYLKCARRMIHKFMNMC
jgi:hypothetical protein